MTKNILKLRIFLWLLLLWSVAGFLYLGIVPSGKISYKTDFTKQNSFIGKLSPETRVVRNTRELPNVIIGNPVYITLATPRKFTEAELRLRYRRINESKVDGEYGVIEAGTLVDNTVWRYDLKPLENEIIDKLSLVWDVHRSGELMLLQRNDHTASSVNKIYDSVENFLEDLPAREEIAVYNYDLKSEFVLPNYRSRAVRELLDGDEDEFTEITQDLRGAYQFYTYLKNEDLDFEFNFVDLNQNKDKDDIDVFFYYENHLIASSHLDDDGVTSDTGERSVKRKLVLKLPDLPEGAYKLEVKVNNDIVTTDIKTKQSKIAFINKLWLAQENTEAEGGLSLFTDSNVVEANTTHTDSLQKIKIGKRELAVEKTYLQYSIPVEKENILDKYSEVSLERDGIIITGNRVFSFSPEAFFNPNIKKLDKYINIAEDGVKYIIASYKTPEKLGEWREASIDFNLEKSYREDGKYSFLISIPGLKAPTEGLTGSFGVELDSVEFKLQGKGLGEKLKEMFKQL